MINESFVAWVAANTNGANIHDSNMLLSNYNYYATHEDKDLAGIYRRMLERFLVSGHGRFRNMVGTGKRSLREQFLIWEQEQNKLGDKT